MLALKNIVKNYVTASTRVEALRGVSVEFRRSEFVSILGPSGCGKTTLLNIIGGLDQYDEGDLAINGVSTGKFRDRDWDSYRNHSVGFVFQSYNLIPHQTVLSNVELALTLSGVSRAERRRRATEALRKVGLADQIGKRPNMLSGGQMQRVAIARALVNDPEILLADEPTGALDSETSLQVMEIMKQVAQDRLVIMVTHNPSLAERYSTRIIRLSDGRITSDSNPYTGESAIAPAPRSGRTRMSFGTALSLSLNNLMTKKARTLLTSFAGSIGIIGIALILALSSGVNSYIDSVQAETLGEYPLTIESQTADMAGIMGTIMGFTASVEERENTDGRIHSVNMMSAMFQSMLSGMQQNDMASFRTALDNARSGPLGEHITAVKYGYDLELSIYREDTSGGAVQVNPSTVVDALYGSTASRMYSTLSQYSMGGMELWNELTGDESNTGYSLVAGAWPEDADELLLIVNEDLLVTDYSLYSLGIRDQAELSSMVESIITGDAYSAAETSYSPEELLDLRFRLLVPTDRYQEEDGVYRDVSGDPEALAALVDDSMTLRVVGVAKAPSGRSAISGSIGYTKALTNYVIDAIDASPVVAAQRENPDTDILTGRPFAGSESITMDDVRQYISSLPADEAASTAAYIDGMTEEEVLALFASKIMPASSGATPEDNLALFGAIDPTTPSSISIYSDSFASKDEITAFIDGYNASARAEGRDDAVIEYTDYVGLLMESVTTITNAISYVLIAFVSVSLVVSSIMIGVITYISVLERTKEIGILRAIGASKGDISRVFNAETVIVGLTSGVMGILITVLLCIPINIIIENLTDISGIAALPPLAGGILVLISVSLTLIAGLLPSRLAAKRDPVVALRTE